MEEHPIYGFARNYNPKLTDSEIKAKYIDNGQYMKTLEMLRKDSYSDLDPDEFLTRFHAKFEDLSKKKAAQDLSGASYSWESGDPKLSAKISSPKSSTSLTGSSGTLTPEAMAASKRASQELALQKARQRPNFEKAADLTEYEKAQAEGSILKPEKEYEARLGILRTDSDNLQRAIEASEARIKEKWGKNWMQDYYARQEAIEKGDQEAAKKQQEFEADQFINDRNKFITALEVNQSSGAQILKDDKYAYARALEEYDQQRLKKSETQGWGNLTLGILQRAAGKLVGSVGEVMNIGENLVTQDKKYGTWDKIEDFFIDFQDQTAKVAPRPTKYTRPLYTKTAKTTLNGEKVEVDYQDDKPAVVRDSKGSVIDVDPNQFKDLKAKNQYNSKGLIYQTGEVLADAMVQIATTKGIGGTLVKTGMGAKLAYATGVTASTMGQMAGGLYDQGLKMFDGDKRKAAQYATMTGLAIGVGSNLFGLEARLAGGPGVFDNLTMTQAVKGLTPKAAAARTATNFFKEGVGEAFEETILEKGIEGATAMVLNGDAEDIDLNEMKGTALISFAVGALMGVGDSDFKNSAWLVAAENPDLFKAELEKQGVKNADKMYQKALKIKGLSEIKEVSEEDIPKLDELTDLQDKAEKAKAIGAKEQAKVFEEQAAAKEVEIFKEREEAVEADENLPAETNSEAPSQEPANQQVETDENLPATTRQAFESSLDQSISDLDITQEQADALKQTTQASAKNWAKRTGKTEEGFYEKFKPTVSRETTQIPDDALKQIVGEKADVPTARKNLQIAKEAEGTFSPQAIYLFTGWEKVDGKWKYDLPDVEVGTLEGTNKLGDVAKGGILNAYPDAKDIEVIVDPNLKTLGVRQGNKITIRDGADKSTLIHELQHWVQQKEGFAGGANLDRVSGGMFSKLQEAKTKFLESNPNLAKALKGENVELSEGDVAKLIENKELLNEYSKTVTDIFNKYRSVVGEVEARNAEARAKMTPAERRLTPISETEDTKNKIFLNNKGEPEFHIVGPKGAENIPAARVYLEVAKDMESAGESPEKIYVTTGWERGADNKWKHEVPDVEIDKNFSRWGEELLLSDVVKNGGRLFKAYPQMLDIPITVTLAEDFGETGVYSVEDETGLPEIWISSTGDMDALESTLVHELQHAIQHQEGWLNQPPEGKMVSMKEYIRQGIEVEARNVENRRGMDQRERKFTMLSETEDIPREDQVFYQQQEGQTLGAFSTIDGAASAWLFDGATVETLFHEIDPTTGHFGHAVLYDILDNALPEYKAQAEADVKAIEDFLGASDRNWTREQHEMFVAAGEKYLREGVAPTPELRPVFERLKQWLTDIFNSIKDRTDIDITPEVRQVFARMMGREEMMPLIEEVNKAEGQQGFASGFIGEKAWGVIMKSGAMNWLKKAWKYTFFGRGDLPIDVAQLNYRRIARIEGMMKQAELTSNKLKKLIKGKSKQQIEDLNYALQSTVTTYSDGRQIEPEILDLIAKMREHVKAMSSELINTGIADGKLAAIISKNLDTYLTRSYQIHFNKNWVKTVKDTAAYTRAKAFLDKKFAQEEADAQAKIAKYQAKLSSNPEYWGKRIKNQQKRIGRDVEAELGAILEKQAKGLSLGDVAKSGSLGSMNFGVFKKRKEIAEEIRDVFGEVKDPIVNYMTSIFKVAHILENNKFLSKVEDEGKDKFLFERPTGPYTSQFPDTPQMGPLAGYYSTPEIVEAFRLYNKPIGDMTDDSNPIEAVYKGMLSITSRAKSFMTIFSIASAARNFTSNLLLQTQKGLFNITNIANGKAFDPNIQKAFDLFKGDNEAELVELYSLGVLGDGITFGEIADIRKQYSRNFAGINNTTTGQLAEKGRMMTKFMSYIYQFGDEFYRAIDYYRNLDKMARLYMGQEYETLSPDAQQEVKQMAAERVSSENPTYSRLPRNIKALRRNPFLAPFPSFPYEMVRVSYNIMDNLVRDMKNGQDTKVKVGGIEMSYKNLMLGKVMAGTMAVSIAPFLLKELITNMLGWSDDDDEKLKYFVPFYHEGSLLIPSPWNEKKGSVDYYDWGYMFPQGHILSTLSTVSDERFSPAENVGRAAEKFFEPFYSPDPLMKSVVEAVSGRQLGKNGRPISQVGETDWLKARMSHVGKKLTPGTIKSFERVFRSFNEPETDYYGKLTPVQELVAIFPGFRSYNVDIHRSFGFIGRNMAEKINDSKADYGVEKNKEQVKALPPKERKEHLDKIKERELKDYERFVLDFHKIYIAAIEFPGVDKKRIDEALADVGLDAITREGVKTGKVKIPEYFKK